MVHTAGGGLELVFGDGAGLSWDPNRIAEAVAPPPVADGDEVWVEYVHRVYVVCPFCGTGITATMEIRDSDGGELLWLGREGHQVTDPGDLVADLFGVAIRKELSCKWTYEAGCWMAERSVFDRVLETAPEQVMPHATRTLVTTPNGSFDIAWATSEDLRTRIPFCADGPDPAPDAGIAVSRIQ